MIDRATGERAVIDWGAAMWSPLLYDIASAYWFFRFEYARKPRYFTPFLEAYRRGAPMPSGELAAIDVFVRLRCAIQAFYFSWRVANNIGTGLTDLAENRKGLDKAQMAWELLG